MKKIFIILSLFSCCRITTSCKKDHPNEGHNSKSQDTISVSKPNCSSSCPQAVGTATVALSPVIAAVNNLPKVRIDIFYYYQSNKKGTFTVTIKNQSQSITLGQMIVREVPSSPEDGSLGMIERDFTFPVALNAYSGYALVVNGQSNCNPACSSFTGYFVP